MSITTNKMLPIGVSDFRKLVEHRNTDGAGYLFVDKTLFIKEILLDGTEAIVLPRPRRFGKTLNMSMLEHFFAPTVNGKSTKGLFDNLKIAEYAGGMEKQGKHPVISISFKEIKHINIEQLKAGMREIISNLYLRYDYLANSDKLAKSEKVKFNLLLNGESSDAQLGQSLYYLSQYIFKDTGVKPYLLIDEYDIPIQEAYLNNYYEDAVRFIRSLLSAALKDNSNLAKGVLTGIVRVSKEDLFSGLNNVKVHSILSDKYSSYFGFLESEVDYLLGESNIATGKEKIKDWYNGYKFGEDTIYNPWSLINCLDEKGKLQPYWVNTSSNKLIKKQIEKSSARMREQLTTLMQGENITEEISDQFVYGDLEHGEFATWSLMVLSGYLKVNSLENCDYGYKCNLTSPNKEVMMFYNTTVKRWLESTFGVDSFKELLLNLVHGEVERFEQQLNEFILESSSFYDFSKDKSERFMHGLMLGLTAGLKDNYIIKSNREGGHGRYDLALIPHDKNNLGIIMEFKPHKENNSKLEDVAECALKQARQNVYATELTQQGIPNILVMGIGFSRKKVKIVV